MPNWIKEHAIFSGLAGAIITVIVTTIIALIPSKNEDKQGIFIGGKVIVSGDSNITGYGNININKEVTETSERKRSIEKYLINLQSQDHVITPLIQKAKDAFYSNKLDEAEKCIEEIYKKQGANP